VVVASWHVGSFWLDRAGCSVVGWRVPLDLAGIDENETAGRREELDAVETAREILGPVHEWWDGTGYPAGLAGEDIPISGRIVAIADVYDALTHRSPYKPAWSITASLHEVERLRGKQFDPMLLDAFAQLDPDRLAGDVPRQRPHLVVVSEPRLTEAIG
jgi:hypothetical protein